MNAIVMNSGMASAGMSAEGIRGRTMKPRRMIAVVSTHPLTLALATGVP